MTSNDKKYQISTNPTYDAISLILFVGNFSITPVKLGWTTAKGNLEI